jgi:succinate-semialdehyde dehydrogenase/glutarate-semialdehyde dehydrogenase
MAVAADPRERAVVEAVPKQLLIDGRWVDGSSGATLPVEDPATGETIAEVADATPDDALAALAAAHDAQAEWRDHPPRERGEILRRAYEVMMERLDDLALLMTLEMGKPVAESKAEVSYAAEFFRWFAEQAVRIDGRFQVAPTGQGRLLVMKQPVGPCYLITPWNFPAAMATRKIGPAVAAGCTMILKPASLTPLSALAVAGILEQVGLPGGVLNVVTSSSSSEVSKPIIGDFRLRKLSFTGSTEVGRKLVEQSAQQLLRVSMELGGNAPFLVFDDADLDAAVEGALIAKMRNIGEACTAANRFYVADPIAEEFAQRLACRANGIDGGRARHRTGREGRPAGQRGAAVQGRRARAGCAPEGGEEAGRRRAPGGPGLLLPAHGAERHPRRGTAPEGGDLRPRGPDSWLLLGGRRDRAGERHGIRPGGVSVHA